MSTRPDDQDTPRVPVPADIQAPDKIAWGLTARQLSILTVAGIAGYGLFQTLAAWLPPAAAAAVLVPVAGLAFAVVLGRRDGLSLDVWLLAALGFRRVPRLQAPAGTSTGTRVSPLVHTTGALPARRRCGCRPRRSTRPDSWTCPAAPGWRCSPAGRSTWRCAPPPNRRRCWVRSAAG